MLPIVPLVVVYLATVAVICLVAAGAMVIASMSLFDASYVEPRRGNWLLYWGTLAFVVGSIMSFLVVCYITVSWFIPILD